MNRAKVFAFPSNLEALPLVVLEAMTCGVPVVCTSLPPGPEIIEDGMTGLLADPSSPSDFAKKIERVLNDPEIACRIVENARKVVAERFSLERCISETERFYEECVAARGKVQGKDFEVASYSR